MVINVCVDKDFQGRVITVEVATRKVPPGGFGRGRGKKMQYYDFS